MRLENWAKILYVDPRDESVGCSVFFKSLVPRNAFIY